MWVEHPHRNLLQLLRLEVLHESILLGLPRRHGDGLDRPAHLEALLVFFMGDVFTPGVGALVLAERPRAQLRLVLHGLEPQHHRLVPCTTRMCIVTRSVQSDSASLQRQTWKPSFMRPLHTLVRLTQLRCESHLGTTW
jgi:hypothetical protein